MRQQATLEQLQRDFFDTQFEIERVRKLSREARNEIEYAMYIDELSVLLDRDTDMRLAIANRLGKKKK